MSYAVGVVCSYTYLASDSFQGSHIILNTRRLGKTVGLRGTTIMTVTELKLRYDAATSGEYDPELTSVILGTDYKTMDTIVESEAGPSRCAIDSHELQKL